mgnify:CR=1 FL=1|jgi:hypothetical protein
MQDKLNKLANKFKEFKDRGINLQSETKVLASKKMDAEKEAKEVASDMGALKVTPDTIDDRMEELFTEAGTEVMRFSKELEDSENKVNTIKEELERI